MRMRMNRRKFLTTGCAACAGAAGFLAAPSLLRGQNGAGPFRIRFVYSLHGPKQEGPDWPNKGFDFVPVMERINAELRARLPEFEFLPTLAAGPEQAEKIVAEDKASAVDGYVVFQMNCWNRVVQTVAATGKPVLYADFQYGGSGGFLVYTAAFLRAGTPNVGFVASSRVEDLAAAVKCFDIVRQGGTAAEFAAGTARARRERTPRAGDLVSRPDALRTLAAEECLRRMKSSRILAVGGQESGSAGEMLVIPVVNVAFAEVNDAWRAADRDRSRDIAAGWKKAARTVVGVTDETLESSAAFYLGMKDVLKKHGANAITINCLGGFYGGHIHAYPCLGFYELLNEGLIGACECDVRSTATMVAVTTLTEGRPGFISDPVIDTAKRQIIYAHCVASNRVFGPRGPANPVEILTHSEDRQGASLRSILPPGYMTTTLEIHPERREILFHQGLAVGNDPDDRACRTKLCAEPVGDIEKLFREWDVWGWHRVTFYGDLKEPVQALAAALGWKVVPEA